MNAIPVNEDKIDLSKITDEELSNGADIYERCYLRPNRYKGKEVFLRMRTNTRFNGNRLKDELVASIGLRIGDTISTDVTVLFGKGLIGQVDDMDLFADGEAADWLMENAFELGTVFDGLVKLSYAQSPTGRDEKMIYLLRLVLVKGLRVVAKN
jgi:hypothetical protein